MKKVLSIILAFILACPLLSAYALSITEATANLSSVFGQNDQIYERIDCALLCDINGDGIDEMIVIDKSNARNVIRYFAYSSTDTGLSYKEFGGYDFFFSGNEMRGKVSFFKSDNAIVFKDTVNWYGGKPDGSSPAATVTYHKITVNADGTLNETTEFYNDTEGRMIDHMAGGETYTIDKEATPAEKAAFKSKYEIGQEQLLFSIHPINNPNGQRLYISPDFKSPDSIKNDLLKKQASAMLAQYSQFSDITDTMSNDDVLKIHRLLSYVTPIEESRNIALFDDEQLLKYVYSILQDATTDLPFEAVTTFGINAGGCITVYNTNDVEDFILSLLGRKINLRTHTCQDADCPLLDMNIPTFETIPSDIMQSLQKRDLIWVYTYGEGENIININKIYELSPDRILALYEHSVFGEGFMTFAIFGKRTQGGETQFYMIEQGGKTLLSADQLKKYVPVLRENSNISLNYGETTKFTELSDYIGYLKEKLSQITPNDSAKEEISKYIEYALSKVATTPVKTKGRKITITAENIADALENAKNAQAEFETVLSESGITLNKKLALSINVSAKGAKLKKGITTSFDGSLSQIADEIGTFSVVFDKNNHAISFSGEALKSILASNTSVYIKAKGNKYMVDFLGADGNKIPSSPAQITLSLKSNGEFDTVFYEHDNIRDNWSGQLNFAKGTIEFMTSLSGVYVVEENIPEISDISDLPDDVQKAIKFMVSRGYFSAEGGIFNPYGTLTRYDFTKILVGMFYAMNYDAKCTFSDVSADNPYHSVVASSQQSQIVKGFEDNTFKGNKNATNEEVISIAARTAVSKKGYTFPENTSDYIQFADNIDISGWENQYGEIALAVREGLINRGGVLAPKASITRADAAVILYKLFNLLYGVTPVTEKATIPKGIIIALCCVPVVVVAGAGTIIFIKRKKR